METILGSLKIETKKILAPGKQHIIMSTYKFIPRASITSTEPVIPTSNAFAAFGFMQKENRYQPDPSIGYRAWKQDQIKPKEISLSSESDFPDLVTPQEKSTSPDIFGGVSLADKLKQTIAAEEEAIRRRRLQDDEKEGRWIREHCVALPCKGLKAVPRDPAVKHAYHHKGIMPLEMPLFYPKTMEQYQYMRKITVLEQLGADIRDLQEKNEPIPAPEEFFDMELLGQTETETA